MGGSPPGLPEPDFTRDGGDTPVVPQFLMALPLYAGVLALLSESACWLQRKLSAPGPLLMQRVGLFVDRLFRVAEDFALVSALDVICLALCEFAEAAWEALLHLNTSPKPSLAAVVPKVVQRGLGAVGSYPIPDDLWREVVPADFLEAAEAYDVERDPQGGAGRVSGLVGQFFSAVGNLGIFRELPAGTAPSVFPFIIPKSSRKVSLILSCVGLNEESMDPPHFALPSWEGICRLLNQTPPDQRLYATHIDLTNAFWSFILPEGVDRAFRARVRPGGPVVGATRLPFGWKFSPYLCQRILGDLLRRLILQGVELLHYLDDFVLVSTDRSMLHGTTQECVRVLVENWFIVSDKSTLEPVQHLFVLGKFMDLQRRMIYSHRRAWLQILAAWFRLAVSPMPGSKLMEKLLGFIQLHIRPRLTSAPLLAGAYCWVRWGDHDRNVPVKILHALASALCLCAEPYRALPWERARQFVSLSRSPVPQLFQRLGPWCWCVDAAWDLFSFRVGGFSPQVGARTWVVPAARHTQQTAELAGLCWGVRIALRLRWDCVLLVTDSEVASAQLVQLKASTWLKIQHAMLRSVSRRLCASRLQVYVVWCPSHSQPGDPLSRVQSDFHGRLARAEVASQCRWGERLRSLHQCRFVGAVVL